MTFDLCRIDWVAIAAILTAIMVFVTYWSLKEMKNERERAEQPRITISLDYEMHEGNGMFVFFAIVNQGLSYANDVEIRFDQDFINAFPEKDSLSDYVVPLNGSTIDIAPGKTFKIYFANAPQDEISRYEQDIIVTCKYNWRKGECIKKSYDDVFVFNLKNYKWFGTPRIRINSKSSTEKALNKIAESTTSIAKNLTKN